MVSFRTLMSSIFLSLLAITKRIVTFIYDRLCVKPGLENLWNRWDKQILSRHTRLTRTDISLCLVFGVIGLMVALWGMSAASHAPGLYTYMSVYLEADVARVADNLVTTGGNHQRTAVHPIASLLLTPIGLTLKSLGLSPVDAARTMVLACAAINAALLCAILRLLGLPQIAVSVFSMLFIVSASFMFWNAVVEIYPFASLSLLLALLLMVHARPVKAAWWSIVSALTLGFTITNWATGLITSAVRLDLKRFLTVTSAALGIVVVLSIIQHMLFAQAAYFFNPIPLLRESAFVQPVMEQKGVYKEGWRPLSNLRSIFVTTVVAMPADVEMHGAMKPQVVTTNQDTGFPKGEISPVFAVMAWLILLGGGIWGAVIRRELRPVSIGLGGILLFNSLLHLVYGEVTFLYSAHFLPPLIMIAAFSWFTPARWLALGLAIVVIVCGGINNSHRLEDTIRSVNCINDLSSVRAFQSWAAVNQVHGEELTQAYAKVTQSDMFRCQADHPVR